MKKLAFWLTSALALAPKVINAVLDFVTFLGKAVIDILEELVRLVELVDSYLERAFGEGE